MDDQPNEQQPLLEEEYDASPSEQQQQQPEELSSYARCRRYCQDLLVSKKKHYFIMALVALDVSCLLADIFITLIDCDSRVKNHAWVPAVHEGLEHAALVFSCLFLAELMASIWAFGFSYLGSWFHFFDAVVIVASFLIDVLTRGVVEEVASLVIILRLWRFVKIIQEMSVGASEKMEDLEMRLEGLEKENAVLRRRLGRPPSADGESEAGGGEP